MFICERDPTPGGYTSDNTLLELGDTRSLSSCSVECGQYELDLGQSSGVGRQSRRLWSGPSWDVNFYIEFLTSKETRLLGR
jgi:hypothetical protein